MSKKILIISILSALGLFAILTGVNFYNNNLSGIGPAIKDPPEKIAEIKKPNFSLKLPPDFAISIYAENLKNPRVMIRDPKGRILVSEPAEGKVVALIDDNFDGYAEKITTVIENLNNPHGLAFNCIEICKLFIAESDKAVEYSYDSDEIKAVNGIKRVDLASGGGGSTITGHYTRTLLFMPAPDETKLLISVGSSCNVCNEEDNQRAKVLVYDTATNKTSEFASGLRNSVFMAIHPVNGEIWATEMGRDQLGDDTPPDEINIIKSGKNYGWPTCYGKNTVDISISSNKVSCDGKTPSHIDLQAHSAPLGLAFIPEEGWPEEYWHNLLVAYHGSWNRSVPTGYKIVKFKLDANGKVLGPAEDFISGWLTPEGALGRPVDIMVEPGGKIYISDDKAGVIYKVSRNAE